MTELIVALDGPNAIDLFCRLHDAGIRWFKLGPQTLAGGEFDLLVKSGRWNVKPAPASFFLDLKLADTADTVREAVRRFAGIGIAAVSTFTDDATEAAMAGAAGSELRVWRVVRLTDSDLPMPRNPRCGDGVICSVSDLSYVTFSSDIDKVCPGVRLLGDLTHGHKLVGTPQEAEKRGASHVVVGRPIWQAPDPVAAAKEFLEALKP